MIINLDKPIETQIIQLLETINPLDELEWRIGTFDRYNNFKSGIKLAHFNHLFETLSKTTTAIINEYTSISYNIGNKDNIRIITDNSNKLIQKKSNIKTIDINFNKCGIRLSRNLETKLNEIDLHKYNLTKPFTRKISRYSFDFKDYIVELSKIGEFNNFIYECEIELINRINIKNIMINLKNILTIIYPTSLSLFTKSYEYSIINKYNSFFNEYITEIQNKNLNFRLNNKPFMLKNKPVNLKPNTNLNINGGYTITNKLDGTNYFLFSNELGIFLINDTDMERISMEPIVINNEILYLICAGELKDYTYAIFDVLFIVSNNKIIDVSKVENLFNRLNYITQNILQDINNKTNKYNFNVIIKTFKYNTNLSISLTEIINYMYDSFGKYSHENNDGLIFTPLNGNYKQYKIYKYKWTDKLSIDFLIDNIITVNDTLKTAKVYVSTKTTNILFNSKLVDFNTHTLHIYKYYNNNINPFFDILISKDIVECIWDKTLKVWMPYKIRYDKIIPNYIDIAEDVFEDILYPPNILDICKTTTSNKININCLDNFNKCSNLEKRKLIEKYSQGIGLDLGIGKLGDLHKYNNNTKITKIWGLEPDDFNRTEAINRLKSKKNLNIPITVLPFKAQDTTNIYNKIKDKIDFVASFFSLTFFYENENILNDFCNTINNNLVDKGYFIGTTMDGKATYDLLYNKESINIDNCYNITKNYDDNIKYSIGQNIYIRLVDTIVDQSEWLAWFEILVNKLKSFNIILIDTQHFNSDEYPQLSNPEKILFNCYRSFVFQKHLPTNKQLIKPKQSISDLKQLKTLPINVVKTFDNTFSDIPLNRVGTIGDGSCFFHSVLYLIDERYRQMDKSDRKNLIKIIRTMFSESLSRKTWKTFGNGNLALSLYQINLNNYLSNKKYKFIDLNFNTNNVDDYIQQLKNSLTNFPKNLSPDILLKYKNLSTETVNKLYKVFDKILETTYNNYLKSIKDTDVWVGDGEDSINIFQYVSDIFNINIFIIRDTTQLPYLTASDCNIMYKNRPSILLLSINNIHFEAIIAENQYMFDFNNKLITNIMNIICKN